MIPSAYITEWRNKAPWPENYQVEQDLIIERALVEIFSDAFLRERLAFRGGTALHKLYLSPQVRYSEDIDLVQQNPEPFGPVIDRLRERLAWLGKPVIKQKQHNNTMVFRVESEEGIPMRLKVETNCREHFSVLGLTEHSFRVKSAWFSGEAGIPVYDLHELLGTKLRALYQRKKGRDLFDIWYALTQLDLEVEKIIRIWRKYMDEEGHPVSGTVFLENMEHKLKDVDFRQDMQGLLRPGTAYEMDEAYGLVREVIIGKMGV
jgi:predicted nucleotidyltransferase component of viral defense system